MPACAKAAGPAGPAAFVTRSRSAEERRPPMVCRVDQPGADSFQVAQVPPEVCPSDMNTLASQKLAQSSGHGALTDLGPSLVIRETADSSNWLDPVVSSHRLTYRIGS